MPGLFLGDEWSAMLSAGEVDAETAADGVQVVARPWVAALPQRLAVVDFYSAELVARSGSCSVISPNASSITRTRSRQRGASSSSCSRHPGTS